MGMKSIFAQSFRHTSAGKPVFRALALCAGALFLAGCGLLSGPDVTPTPTRPMAAVVPTFTSTPVGAAGRARVWRRRHCSAGRAGGYAATSSAGYRYACAHRDARAQCGPLYSQDGSDRG